MENGGNFMEKFCAIQSLKFNDGFNEFEELMNVF